MKTTTFYHRYILKKNTNTFDHFIVFYLDPIEKKGFVSPNSKNYNIHVYDGYPYVPPFQIFYDFATLRKIWSNIIEEGYNRIL
jgi:hypothetical protein